MLCFPRVHSMTVLLVFVIGMGCQSVATLSAPGREQQVQLLEPRELVEMVQAGENIVFLDVREPSEYAENHIPGAINIPQREFAQRVGEIDKDALIVPYCNMDFRGFYAVRELRQLGFSRIALMRERGIYGWQAAGLPYVHAGVPEEQALAGVMVVDSSQLSDGADPVSVQPSGQTRHVRIDAANWHFDPNDLTVNAGDRIHLILRATEGDHFFVQPDYEIGVELKEGETHEVSFLADRPGEFRFGSCEWDGSELQVMKGRIRVLGAVQ